jgi:hypothetical protein
MNNPFWASEGTGNCRLEVFDGRRGYNLANGNRWLSKMTSHSQLKCRQLSKSWLGLPWTRVKSFEW